MERTSAAVDYRATVRNVLGAGRGGAIDMVLRITLVSVVSLVLAYIISNKWIVIWLLAYLLLEFTFNVHGHWRLKQASVDARAYWILMGHYAGVVAVFCILPLFLISMNMPEFQFVGFAAVSGHALHALLNQNSTRHVVMIYGASVVLLAIAAALTWTSNTDYIAGKVLIVLSALAVSLFFMHTILAINTRAREAEAARSTLAHAQKMEVVGRLSSGISHDFNNLLTVIAGNLDLLKETKSQTDREMLEKEARSAVDRGAKLVRQLQAASRKSELEVTQVKLADFLSDFESMARRVLPANIELIQQGAPQDDLIIFVDRSQLDSALLNLVINARDAMEESGGTLWITTHILHLNAIAPEVASGELRRGTYVRIEIEDTGTGIPASMIDKITEPYVTTKPEGKGSGLGLAMVKGFAEQSGGGVFLHSQEGQGTSVQLFLPV